MFNGEFKTTHAGERACEFFLDIDFIVCKLSAQICTDFSFLILVDDKTNPTENHNAVDIQSPFAFFAEAIIERTPLGCSFKIRIHFLSLSCCLKRRISLNIRLPPLSHYVLIITENEIIVHKKLRLDRKNPNGDRFYFLDFERRFMFILCSRIPPTIKISANRA